MSIEEEEENDISNILIDNETSLNSALNLSEEKPVVKHPKPLLKCVVCNDNAFGYNFDAVSCESCKAFFRRNALRPSRLKCRGNGHCEVTVETRKRCKKCRLEKCFRMGMRKEWILSDAEKRRKKHQIKENRRIKQTQEPTPRRIRRRQTTSKTDNSSSGDISLPPITTTDSLLSLLSPMSESDWSKVRQVQTAYSEAMAFNQVVGVPPYPATHTINNPVDLIQVPTYLSSLRLITYLKKTPEFDTFDSEDRVTLVKHNLLAVVFIHIILVYDPVADTYHEHNTQDPIFQGKDWIHILGEDFYNDLTATAKKLIEILEYDRVIAKFLLLIVLYDKGFCGYDIMHEPSLNNPSLVLDTQNIYVETLYKYCLHQYGLTRTIHLFTHLINQLFAVQRLAVHLKHCVHAVMDPSQLSPLMQSVLQLSDPN